jgi:hypothetical protein
MFQTQPGQNAQEAHRAARPPSFLTLIVLGLSLIGLLVALEMSMQQNRATISHQQVVSSVEK